MGETNESSPVDNLLQKDRTDEIIINSIILYFGIFANILLLIHLIKTRKKWTRVSFFILWLCISDILGVGVRQGVIIAWNTSVVWQAGEDACKTSMFFLWFGCTLAHYILASLNIDNLITVVAQRSVKAVRIILVVISLGITIVANAPEAFVYSVEEHPMEPTFTQCVSFTYFKSETSESVYFYMRQASLFWVPIIITMVTGLSGFIIWSQKNGKFAFEEAKKSNEFALKTIGGDMGLVGVFNIVFFVCWSPASVFAVLNRVTPLYRLLEQSYIELLGNCGTYLALLNSCLNPVIYVIALCVRRSSEKSEGL